MENILLCLVIMQNIHLKWTDHVTLYVMSGTHFVRVKTFFNNILRFFFLLFLFRCFSVFKMCYNLRYNRRTTTAFSLKPTFVCGLIGLKTVLDQTYWVQTGKWQKKKKNDALWHWSDLWTDNKRGLLFYGSWQHGIKCEIVSHCCTSLCDLWCSAALTRSWGRFQTPTWLFVPPAPSPTETESPHLSMRSKTNVCHSNSAKGKVPPP